jgi:hypothetical protein
MGIQWSGTSGMELAVAAAGVQKWIVFAFAVISEL